MQKGLIRRKRITKPNQTNQIIYTLLYGIKLLRFYEQKNVNNSEKDGLVSVQQYNKVYQQQVEKCV